MSSDHGGKRVLRTVALLLALLLVVGILFFVFAAVAHALSVPSPTSEFYINDFAGVLNRDTCNEVLTKGVNLQKATGAQVVVVVVENMGGADRDSYALEILRSWGVGDKQKNNGVVLLVSIQDRQVKLEVGYGLEGALPDGKCGRILDDAFVPNMRNDDVDAAVLNTYDALLVEVCDEYQIDPNTLTQGTSYRLSEPSKSEPDTDLISIVFVVIFVAISIVSSIFRWRRGGRGGGHGGWGGGGSGWGGGGGWSGGGGGGFSGGGGSGGGGGAGRGW